MNRSGPRFVNLLVLAACASNGFPQQPNAPSDPGRRADIYAIYSLMMTDPKTSHGPGGNDIYLIAEKTEPGIPAEPCVRVPAGYEDTYREILADYKARRDQPATVERALTISKPYRLLNGDEAAEFVRSRTIPFPDRARVDPFPGSTDLFRLGDIYFNRQRTMALTALSSWCGKLCALWSWRVFEKASNGQWEERRWVGCMTIARGEGMSHRKSNHRVHRSALSLTPQG